MCFIYNIEREMFLLCPLSEVLLYNWKYVLKPMYLYADLLLVREE